MAAISARPGGRTAAALLIVVVAAFIAPAAQAQQPPPPPGGPPPVALRFPAAFVVVDADTGTVIAGLNDREPRPPASTTKILTALVVRRRLERNTPVPISARAAATPARKLNLLAGETWKAGDLLQAMLICSCNDAAVALAEAAGDGLDGYGRLARELAGDLGLRDRPTLADPSGLDDEFSVGGGNLISARDLAIATRAFLKDKVLASIVVAPNHRFVGGDGEIHEVVNHNRLLPVYPGAVGVKTGFTRRAGSSLVAAARRNGRTIIAVLLDSPDVYLQASQLLDLGFATKGADLRGLPVLTVADERARTQNDSGVTTDDGSSADLAPPAGSVEEPRAVDTPDAAARTGANATDTDGPSWPLVLGATVLVPVVLVATRRRHVVRKRRRRAADRALR